MTLGSFISVLNNIDILIMATDGSGKTKTIYEGESRFYRMCEDEGYLHILFIAPHKCISGGIFIMVEG